MKTPLFASLRSTILAAVGAAAIVAACEPSSGPPPVTAPSSDTPPPITATVPAPDAATTPVTVEGGDAGEPVTSNGANNELIDASAAQPPLSQQPSPHGPPPHGGLTPDITGCTRNTDCVAVPRGGCCNNGWLEAVNAQKVEAYRQASRCIARNVMCTHLMVNDQRVPHCSTTTHLCEMIPPDKTSCGGIAGPANACPQGYTCQIASRLPDASGTCRKNASP